MKSRKTSLPAKGLSRRGFLKGLGISGLGAAVTATTPAQSLAADTTTTPNNSSEELVTVLDISKCIGCGECVDACRESNAHKFPEVQKPIPPMFPPRVKVEDWSDKRDVDDRLTPYNWLFIQTAEGEHNGEEYSLSIPRRCLHCTNPPCANLCPWGAARKEDNGIVRIDEDICLGGAKCRQACPWDIPQRQSGTGLYLNLMPRFAGNGLMLKCDRCYDKIADGGTPACIKACPEGVQTIGPRSEMIELAKKLAAEMNGHLYGLDENGGTNTIYVSPVPFSELNKSVEKGAGKPDFAPVEDKMAPEHQLAKVLVAAPVAGIVAGVLKATATAKRLSKQDGLSVKNSTSAPDSGNTTTAAQNNLNSSRNATQGETHE